MPAFRETAMHRLNEAIVKLYQRMGQTNVFEFTHEELMDMFVPKGEHEVLFKIRHLTTETFANSSFKYSWRCPADSPVGSDWWNVVFDMRDVPDKKHPAVPRCRDLNSAAALESLGKIDTWLARRWELGINYSRVKRVLEGLNQLCASPQQVKFLWPSIVSLCKMHPDTRFLGDAMERARTPGTIPTLSPALRAACRKTSGAIAVANLLTDVEEVTREVTISCAGVSVTEEGLGTWTSF